MRNGVTDKARMLGARLGISILMPAFAIAGTGITALAWTPASLRVGDQWIDTEDGKDHEISFERGTAKYVAATNTLILTDATIPVVYNDDSDSYNAIYTDEELNIQLVGDNIIDSSEENTWAIYSEEPLTITGGSLTITADTICIFVDDELTVTDATLNLTATGDEIRGSDVGYGIFGRSEMNIRNSNITADASHCGIHGGDNVNIDESTITLTSGDSAALYSYEFITITDSTVTAETTGDGSEDDDGIYAWYGITITDSDVTASSVADDGIYARSDDIIITNSTVNASGKDYGIYAGGDITIQYNSVVTATSEESDAIYADTYNMGGDILGGHLNIEDSIVVVTGGEAGLHSERDMTVDADAVVETEGNPAILIEPDEGAQLKLTQPDGTTDTYASNDPILSEKILYIVDGKIYKEKPVEPSKPTRRTTTSTAAKTADETPCNHSYVWETYKAATATTDGIMRYRCKYCGDVEYEVPTAAYYVFNKEAQESIQKAAQGATVTVSTPVFISFHEMVKDALKARPDVTLVVDYKNAGKSYEMTIPAGSGDTLDTLFGDSQYAGFLYLGGAFATVEK